MSCGRGPAALFPPSGLCMQLFHAMTAGDWGAAPPRSPAALLHDLKAAGGDRVPPALLARVRACMTRPSSTEEAYQCLAALHAALGEAMWRDDLSASGGLWTERRRRLTNDWDTGGPRDPARTTAALALAAVVIATRFVGGLPWATHVLRLVCKPVADALAPARLLLARGLPPALHPAFLRQDEHGLAPWVRLAARQGVWVHPASAATAVPGPLALAPATLWAVVQWATTRCFLAVQAGRVQAALSMHRCVPAEAAHGYPAPGAAVEALAPTPSTSQPGVLRQRLGIAGFPPKVVLIICWGTTAAAAVDG